MSARHVRAHSRPLVGALVLVLIGSTPVMAEERAAGAIPPTPLPTPVLSAGLSAGTPLSGDAVAWTTLSAPPAHGEAAGMLQGGGGGPRFRYYGLDALGSVRVVFDGVGAVVSRADYEPFGAAAATTTGPQPREQYTGHERDGEVGVDYFGARLYLAALGRMPSVDPLYVGALGDPQRWNRYAYALNNPISMVDPDGRVTCTGMSVGHVSNCSGTVVVPNEAKRPSPPSGPVFSFGVSTFEFFGLGSNETYYLSQYGYIPEFGSQTVDFPTNSTNTQASTTEVGEQISDADNRGSIDPGKPPTPEAGPMVAQIVQRIGPILARMQAQASALAGRLFGASRAVDANKLNHIFGKAEHGLDNFVRAQGGQEKAFAAIQAAANQALAAGKLMPGANGVLPSGNAGHIIDVGGTQIRLIGGRVVNGVVEIGSASRMGLP